MFRYTNNKEVVMSKQKDVPTFDLDEFVELETQLFSKKLRKIIDKLPSDKKQEDNS